MRLGISVRSLNAINCSVESATNLLTRMTLKEVNSGGEGEVL